VVCVVQAVRKKSLLLRSEALLQFFTLRLQIYLPSRLCKQRTSKLLNMPFTRFLQRACCSPSAIKCLRQGLAKKNSYYRPVVTLLARSFSSIPDELLYTKSHEWVRIKSYEDSGLGDLEEVSELPEGDEFTEEQREAFKKEQEQKFAQEKKLPVGIIGITDIAQERLGDLVFIDFPKFGAEIGAGEAFGSVESVKAASEIYMPLSGTVCDVNSVAVQDPGVVNTSPYEEGWLLKARLQNFEAEKSELMSAEEYKKYCEQEEVVHAE